MKIRTTNQGNNRARASQSSTLRRTRIALDQLKKTSKAPSIIIAVYSISFILFGSVFIAPNSNSISQGLLFALV